MQFALASDNRRVTAEPGGAAACPQCHKPVIAKCGPIVAHHWAHEAHYDCDPWWEHETPWHRKWKALVPATQVEVTRGPHRADIVHATGRVVELQHSPISVEEIRERENFYGNMLWLFDGRDISSDNLQLRPRDGYYSFRWCWPRKTYNHCRKPVVIDLDGCVFRLRKLYLDEPPYGGWGTLYSERAFIQWLTQPALNHEECNT